MSQLLEKLRRAAEVFADPKAEKEVSDDEKGVKAKEKVVQKVESIFKKPHRAVERAEVRRQKGGRQNEVFGENHQAESGEPTEGSKREKKRVRLNIGVKSEDGREKNKKVQKEG